MVVKLEKEIHLNRLLQVLSSANTYTRNTKLMLKETHSAMLCQPGMVTSLGTDVVELCSLVTVTVTE